MTSRHARWLIPVLLATVAPLLAEPVTIYRCTDEHGRLTLRDTPCRAGQRQQTREMLRPRDPPPTPPAPPVTEPAPPPARPAATRVVVARPPRPLYECVTPEGEVYTSDTGQGDPRWVPLWTLGYPVILEGAGAGSRFGHRIGAPTPEPPRDRPGVPRRPPVLATAYGVGTWVRDECHPLPQREVCDRLRDRDSELRRQYNSALQSERRRITSQRRGIDARLAADCTAG